MPLGLADKPAGRSRAIVIAGVVLLLLGFGAFAFLGGGSGSGGGSDAGPTAVGRLTLIGGGGYTRNNPCVGTPSSIGDNTGLQGGTPVRMVDPQGTLVGSTTLSDGNYFTESTEYGEAGYCRFSFEMALDTEAPRYELIIGDRDPIVVDDPSNIDLTSGRGRPPSS